MAPRSWERGDSGPDSEAPVAPLYDLVPHLERRRRQRERVLQRLVARIEIWSDSPAEFRQHRQDRLAAVIDLADRSRGR